jgi:hypothetical protein
LQWYWVDVTDVEVDAVVELDGEEEIESKEREKGN